MRDAQGRVIFSARIITGDYKSFKRVYFKLDSGSDFTTISCDDLKNLGYTLDFLEKCPFHGTTALSAFGDSQIQMQYILNVSIKFGDRELQGCRIFFALNTNLHGFSW